MKMINNMKSSVLPKNITIRCKDSGTIINVDPNILNNKLDNHCHGNNSNDTRKVSVQHNLPPNLTKYPIIYNFEVFIDGEQTGIMTSITVLPTVKKETKYHMPDEFIFASEVLPDEGGKTTAIIKFGTVR